MLRKLRHGPLSIFSPVWMLFGRIYRFVIPKFGQWVSVSHKIGSYGPFKMDSEFTFSDFESWGGQHNNGFEACVESAKDAKCFLDVGGHIGLVTMPVAKVILGTVYTFEPAKANLKHLKSHIAKNNLLNVVITESLVGDEEKNEVKFFEQASATGQNALAVKKEHHKYNETKRSQITLDNFCEQNNLTPDIIKIDVEGAEWFVLNGAREIIKKNKPKIFLSLHPVELTLLGKNIESVLKLIKELDYVITEIDGSNVSKYRLSEYLMLPTEDKK